MIKYCTRFCVLILTLGFATLPLAVQAQSRLEKIANSLEENSTIEHIENQVVLNGLAGNSLTPILFDVRTQEEFSVSHLANAIRVDPEINPQDFLREYGNLLTENEVIFYCSTGRRSTELAENVAAILQLEGKLAKPKNMKGGIFRWHNEYKPLSTAAGETEKMHPFNWFWKRLLTRKDQVSYTP